MVRNHPQRPHQEWENWTIRIEQELSNELLIYAAILAKKHVIKKADRYHMGRWLLTEMNKILRSKVTHPEPPSPQPPPATESGGDDEDLDSDDEN